MQDKWDFSRHRWQRAQSEKRLSKDKGQGTDGEHRPVGSAR